MATIGDLDHSPADAPWRRNENDTTASWKAFKHYLLAGPTRSLVATSVAMGHNNPRTVKGWSSKKKWVARTESYDVWLLERGERDKVQAEEIAEYGKDLQRIYTDTMKASQVLLKLTIHQLAKMQEKIQANKDGGPDVSLGELTKAITTALRAIDTSSSARGTLLGVDAIQDLLKAQ